MKFLYNRFPAKCDQIVRITFTKPTEVRLIAEDQYDLYKKGFQHEYIGGHYEQSPVEFEIPKDGVWYAIVEKGTYSNPLDIEGKVEVLGPRYETLNGSIQMETQRRVQEYDDTLE